MALGKISIKIVPAPEEVARRIGIAWRKFSDFRPVFEELYPQVVDSLREVVRSAGGDIGALWPALLESTVRRKNRDTPGGGPLVGLGNLMLRIGDRKSISRMRLRVAPRDRYAYVQNFGSPKHRMPARPFIGISPVIHQIAINLIGSYAGTMMDEITREISGG